MEKKICYIVLTLKTKNTAFTHRVWQSEIRIFTSDKEFQFPHQDKSKDHVGSYVRMIEKQGFKEIPAEQLKVGLPELFESDQLLFIEFKNGLFEYVTLRTKNDKT